MSHKSEDFDRRKSRRLAGLKPDHEKSVTQTAAGSSLQQSPSTASSTESTANEIPTSSSAGTSSQAFLDFELREQPEQEIQQQTDDRRSINAKRRRLFHAKCHQESPRYLAILKSRCARQSSSVAKHSLDSRHEEAQGTSAPANHSSTSSSDESEDGFSGNGLRLDIEAVSLSPPLLQVQRDLDTSIPSSSDPLSVARDDLAEGSSTEQPTTSSSGVEGQARISPFAAQRMRFDRDTGAPLRASVGLARVVLGSSPAPAAGGGQATSSQGESFCRCSQQSQSRDLMCTCGEDDTG